VQLAATHVELLRLSSDTARKWLVVEEMELIYALACLLACFKLLSVAPMVLLQTPVTYLSSSRE